MSDDPTERLLCVGGPLHGRVVEIPTTSKVLYADAGISVTVQPPAGFATDTYTLRATAHFALYMRKRASGGLLILAWTELKSSDYDAKAIDALAIAAGLTHDAEAAR